MTRNVAIVGIGQTKCGRREDATLGELSYESVKSALLDSELTRENIDAGVEGSMPGYEEGISEQNYMLADALGLASRPLMRIATCGTTGGSIFHCAYFHVASGIHDVVLAVGHEKMNEGDPQGVMSNVADPYIQRPFMGGAPGMFALQATEYLAEYDVPYERAREAAARIAVRNHAAGAENPYAHLRFEVSVDDVLESDMLDFPIRMLDCCPSSDGACAIVLASEDKAKEISDDPIWVRAVCYAGDEQWYGDKNFARWPSARRAAKRAYEMAGIENPRKELDIVEIYNPFTWQELIWYEVFDFCGEGKAVEMVEEGVTEKDGDLPITPSGGTLCTNPIGATGMQRIAEAALQIRGEASGWQIPGSELTFAHAMGGSMQFNAITILGKEPRK